MSEPIRFCIRSVTPEERRALEALDPPARPHDCISACTDCFHTPVLARADGRVSDDEVVELLRAGRSQIAATAVNPPSAR